MTLAAFKRVYHCTGCMRRFTDKSLLVTKTAQFRELGEGGKVVKARVVDYLCKANCLPADEDWLLEAMPHGERRLGADLARRHQPDITTPNDLYEPAESSRAIGCSR